MNRNILGQVFKQQDQLSKCLILWWPHFSLGPVSTGLLNRGPLCPQQSADSKVQDQQNADSIVQDQ